MRIGLSGWNGFLATKLRETSNIDWTKNTKNIDYYIHMGSPIFTQQIIDSKNSEVIYKYVADSIALFESVKAPIIFASTTGVNDIHLDHSGSTVYNLAKLYLENYLLNTFNNSLILRIGTIYSLNLEDIKNMKGDRIQPRLIKGDTKDIPFEDMYLNIDTFISETLSNIGNTGILEYPLDKLNLTNLMI